MDQQVIFPQSTGVPIDNLLATDFLDLFDEDLLSYTIWDHCVEHFCAIHDANLPATSVDFLVESLKPFLATSVIAHVRGTLEALRNSTLGVDTAIVPSLKNVFDNIIIDLKSFAYGNGRALLPLEHGRGPEWAQGRGRGSERAQGRGRGRRGETQRRFERSQDGDDDGDDGEASGSRAQHAQFFTDALRVAVVMDVFTTPPKTNREKRNLRKLSIADRAKKFAEHPVVVILHMQYSPFDDDGVACFYHGTRMSMTNGFSRAGILPTKPNTEFSTLAAFYVTNMVAAAFEFPLHNRLARDVNDTVAVFCFELDLKVLHGQIPCPSGKTFKVRWFEEEVHDESWERFCVSHLYGGVQKQHSYDVVIGSMCLPNRRLNSVTPRREMEGLLQVAFCTEVAWTWVGSCVKRLFIEKRELFQNNNDAGSSGAIS